MSNKTDLQTNNAELTKVLQAIQALPSANAWGGGTTIEATEPVTIPAYTDKEITVVPKGVQGIDYGIVTLATPTRTFSVNHRLGVVPKITTFIPYNAIYGMYNCIGAVLSFNMIAGNMNGWLTKFRNVDDDIVNNVLGPTGFPISSYYVATETTLEISYGDIAKGTYYWIAIA